MNYDPFYHIPPIHPPEKRPQVLRQEIASEINRIIEDLKYRRPFLRDTWSRHRDRGPFLDTVVSRWRDLPASDLLCLHSDLVLRADAFFCTLLDFEMYIRFTEDMPEALLTRFDRSLDRLKELGEGLIDDLGGAQEIPLVEFEIDRVESTLVNSFHREKDLPTPENVDADAWAEETRKRMAELYVDAEA